MMKSYPVRYVLLLLSLMASTAMAQVNPTTEQLVTQQLATIVEQPDPALSSLSVLAIKSGKVMSSTV